MPCRNHPEIEAGLARCERCGGAFCPDCVVLLSGKAFCADCKGEQVRDLESGADTTALDLASTGRRFGAQVIDGFAVEGISVVLGAALGAMGAGPVAGFVAGILCVLLYDGVLLQMRGQTLGKMALKVKVVTPEGGALRPGQAWARALSKLVLGSMLVDYLPAFFTK